MEYQQRKPEDELSGLHWTEIITVALQEKAKGNLSEARRLFEECARLHADDAGGRGWALYNLFVCTMEENGQRAAAPLALEILGLESNLASKLFVASAAIDFYMGAADQSRAKEIAAALSKAVEKWSRRSPPASDDISLQMAAQVINQIAWCGLTDAAPEIRFERLKCDHRILASLEAARLDRKMPRLYNALSPQMTHYLQHESVKGTLRFRIADNVTLARCGEFAFALDSDGTLLPLFYGEIPHFYKAAIEEMIGGIDNVTHMPGVSFCSFDQFNQGVNFCHWLVDYLPRIALAQKFGVPHDSIIIPGNLEMDFLRYSCDRIRAGRPIISIEPGRAYRFERLVYADSYGRNLRHPMFGGMRELCDLVRERLMETSVSAKSRKLYVPRKVTRRVANDDALWRLLSNRGFVRIDTDTMPFASQIEAFRAATHIIGPHGAALTNIIFSSPGAHVLELFPRFGGSAAFYIISMAMGHDYSCFVDQSSLENSDHKPSALTFVDRADMVADLDFVANWLTSCDA